MDEACDFPKWDELIPDALGLIFKKLSLVELLTVVPRVCKSWGKAVSGPYCWQEIDIVEWSRTHETELVERMLQLLVSRSCGSLRKLSVSGVSSDQNIFFIVNHAQSLKTLHLPGSHMNNSVMERAAPKLSCLTSLDLSYCGNIGAQALEAAGKHCKSLTTLRRVMHPLEVIDKLSQDDEALAIAATMPKLKHLEIAYLLVETPSVVKIIENCKELELLDIRGCWQVKLDEKLVKRFPNLKVVGPLVVDFYDMNGWDNCSDNSSSSGYLPWDFADDVDDEYNEMLENDFWEDELPVEDVGMWFYYDINVADTGYDWPQSP
ncbi:hypothetical protein SASPL_151854 [Salvia splendens]|uniref:F-box domain-containing protein n=1 Tax=Salvia splendens TaxID=180675 RepID=A0A8X8Z0D4_SALSN|nr:F-box protein FBW2-like [Salvia splendens]XP_042039141.1 F-box protein FBW2-like [Salvia splendens]XP_042039142.1 F-box protein FBW2-like [Salvia splendens]XP_042039143.1 F-box protein FBW2-like [Salvia splendens]KAG6386684.1 hypothetical protein SASPL_151854 [Salvia splendens]